MNVKTFTAMTEAGLDRKVNNLLNGNSFDVVDIKYSSSIFLYVVMVIYRQSNKE